MTPMKMSDMAAQKAYASHNPYVISDKHTDTKKLLFKIIILIFFHFIIVVMATEDVWRTRVDENCSVHDALQCFVLKQCYAN